MSARRTCKFYARQTPVNYTHQTCLIAELLWKWAQEGLPSATLFRLSARQTFSDSQAVPSPDFLIIEFVWKWVQAVLTSAFGDQYYRSQNFHCRKSLFEYEHKKDKKALAFDHSYTSSIIKMFTRPQWLDRALKPSLPCFVSVVQIISLLKILLVLFQEKKGRISRGLVGAANIVL